MTKAEKEKIFEIADMLKDIVQLDEVSLDKILEKIKECVRDYYQTKQKILEICQKKNLDIGNNAHRRFISMTFWAGSQQGLWLANRILEQMFAEIDAEREKQDGEKNV